VGATAVAVVKTNNTTLTAGRGKKFKFGEWCMHALAMAASICTPWPSSHAPAPACLPYMACFLRRRQLLACIGQRRPASRDMYVRFVRLGSTESVLLCMANMASSVLLPIKEQQTPTMHGDVSSNGARCICQSLTSLAFAWQITLWSIALC
jgi:hypothetical protein